MKTIAYILSLYITALSLVPCADGMVPLSVKYAIEEDAFGEHHHSEDHKDDCTPFCICVCCGSMIVFSNDAPQLNDKVDISRVGSFQFYFDYSFDYNHGVWHPPVIS